MIDKTIKIIICAFFILYPVFYLNTTPDSYEYNKMALLIFSALSLLLLTGIKIARGQRLEFKTNSFTLPFFFLSLIYLVSTLIQSPNIVLAAVTPLSGGTILSGFLFFALLVYNFSDKEIGRFFTFLVIDACVISLFVILSQLGILPQSSFTPAGTLLSTATFLAIITIYLLVKIINDLILTVGDASEGSQESLKTPLLNIFVLLLIAGTAIFLTVKLYTSVKPVILPLSFGWSTLLEILKNPKTLAFGIGPANFITAFTMAKPVAFNATPYWNVIFAASSSFLLTLAAETGLLAGLFYLVLLLKSIKLLRSLKDLTLAVTLLFSLLTLTILPGSMVVFITIIILLAAASPTQTAREFHFSKIGILSYLLLLPVLLFVGTVGYFGGKYYWAEVTFKKSLDAMLNSKGEETYRLQDQAVLLNPHMDRYRVAFSRTSLALANAIAAKSQLSETDKQNIPNLVKQAIEQARAAVSLNRTHIINWDNLGRVYSTIIAYAQGAEKWAAYSYQQKLLLDPAGPNAHLDLAGLNLEIEKWTEAENFARRAIYLKPDLANAHYYLSLALYNQKKYEEAYTQLKNTYDLLDPQGDDAQKVAAELEKLSGLLPKKEPPASKGPAFQSQTDPLLDAPSSLPTISLPEVPQ